MCSSWTRLPWAASRGSSPRSSWLKRRCRAPAPSSGFRDIMDDAASTSREWRKKASTKSSISTIPRFGSTETRNSTIPSPNTPSRAHQPQDGLCRLHPAPGAAAQRHEPHPPRGKDRPRGQARVVTTGGGGDGYPLMDAYLRMLEQGGGPRHRVIFVLPARSCPARTRGRGPARRRRQGAVLPFLPTHGDAHGMADAIVTMAATTPPAKSCPRPSRPWSCPAKCRAWSNASGPRFSVAKPDRVSALDELSPDAIRASSIGSGRSGPLQGGMARFPFHRPVRHLQPASTPSARKPAAPTPTSPARTGVSEPERKA